VTFAAVDAKNLRRSGSSAEAGEIVAELMASKSKLVISAMDQRLGTGRRPPRLPTLRG